MTFTQRPPVWHPPLSAVGKSTVTGIAHTTEVSGKIEFTDTLTNLDNFDTVTGSPTISSGMFTATTFTVIRCKSPLLSDYSEIEATIGAVESGKSRIMFCGDANFGTWYGIEVETGLLVNNWTVCQGKAINSALKTYTAQGTSTSDVAKVRYDKPNGLLRIYRNGGELDTIAAAPKGLRYWGLATGIDGSLNVGVKFTSVTARDL